MKQHKLALRVIRGYCLVAIISGQAAYAALFDGAFYEKNYLHKPLSRSVEPELGEKLDLQVIAAHYARETRRVVLLLKASDLAPNRIKNSPLVLYDARARDARNQDAGGYGAWPGFNILITENGKIVTGFVFVEFLDSLGGGTDLLRVSYDSAGIEPETNWANVKIKLGLPGTPGYTYVGYFDLERYTSSEFDPDLPYVFLGAVADRELNQLYRSQLLQLRKSQDENGLMQLRSSERDWIKIRDQQCGGTNETERRWQNGTQNGGDGRCEFIETVRRINFLRGISTGI